jgi:site-specific DNA recombinase
VRRKHDEIAAAGRPNGGAFRPFGYDDDRVTVRPDEAEVIRALVARFLAGESARSLATWLDDQGVKTVAGGPWKTTTLRAMLRSGRIAGLREHRGTVVGPAVWPAIITVEERDRVLAAMAAKKSSGRRAPQRYLLSGLVRCGKCGQTLYSSARRERSGKETRRYVCLSGPDHGGCGGTMVVAGPLEDLITDAVLYRLDTPDLSDALAGRAAADEEAAGLSEAISADRAQLDELAGLYADRQIGAREWLAARNPIEERVRSAEKRLGRMTRTETLTGLVGNAEALRSQWGDLSLSRRHAIITAVLDHVVIGPGRPGVQAFDRDRADPVWRL